MIVNGHDQKGGMVVHVSRLSDSKTWQLCFSSRNDLRAESVSHCFQAPIHTLTNSHILDRLTTFKKYSNSYLYEKPIMCAL